MKYQPKVSIIVPCYKAVQYIHTCINSVLGQSYNNWELILVDDGSPDDSGQICDEYAQKDHRIIVIHKTNGGLSDARNAGLEKVSGEFITFLDSDDFWHRNYLEIMLDLQHKYDADIVQCKWTRGNDSVFPLVDIIDDARCMSGKETMAHGLFDVMMCMKIYRRALLGGVKMPVGIVNEDDWTSWKICYKAQKYVTTNNKLYYYTFNQNGICATTYRKLDITYFGAFKEKDDFFKQHNNMDCVVWNLKKWNNAIILAYHNEGATSEQRETLLSQFEKNYKELCGYKTFRLKNRLYFRAFMIAPMFVSKFSEGFRNFKRDRRLVRYKKSV